MQPTTETESLTNEILSVEIKRLRVVLREREKQWRAIEKEIAVIEGKLLAAQKERASNCTHPPRAKRVRWEETGCYSKPETFCMGCGQDLKNKDVFYDI